MMTEYQMRRKDRETDETTAKEILKNAQSGVLSTIGRDGYPYGVPVNYIIDGNKIYFHCAWNVGHKIENIKYSDKVCFTAVEASEVVPEGRFTRYRSAIVFGKAKRMTDDRHHALELLLDKYCLGFKQAGLEEIEKMYNKTDIVEITIEKISGKIHL